MDVEIQTDAARLVRRLRQAGLRITVAESCTGGLLASTLTDIAGASDWFDQSWVTYANDAKTRVLGVTPDTLERKGAVSAEVAIQMASGALARSTADIALSVTGIAGPGGGSEEKPVGTVYMAWQFPGREAVSERFHFHGDREEVRRQSVATALSELARRAEAIPD